MLLFIVEVLVGEKKTTTGNCKSMFFLNRNCRTKSKTRPTRPCSTWPNSHMTSSCLSHLCSLPHSWDSSQWRIIPHWRNRCCMKKVLMEWARTQRSFYPNVIDVMERSQKGNPTSNIPDIFLCFFFFFFTFIGILLSDRDVDSWYNLFTVVKVWEKTQVS